jgi:predicted RecB family nuclease
MTVDLTAPIETLGLEGRARNSLRRAGIRTIADLTTRSEDDLLNIQTFGPSSLAKVQAALAAAGLALATQKSPAGRTRGRRRRPRSTPTDRSIQAQIAAHLSWANTKNRTARTEAARKAAAASLARFERQVDPDRVLDPKTRRQQAASARKAHMLQMTRAAMAAHEQPTA